MKLQSIEHCTQFDDWGRCNKMETLLGREGAWVDAIYYCPHHPDRGFRGEIPELKIDCACRQPKTGLFEQAMRECPFA
jgi:mannose-1-phosphate guanylyltransferase/phosphomannomutase